MSFCHNFVNFTAQHQSVGILLESSNVSITAGDGAVVSSLTTVTQNPGETFTYELIEEAQLPFRIQGNKLLVANKEGLDFQVSDSAEPLIAISVISRGSLSNPLTESFFIRIVGKYDASCNHTPLKKSKISM